MNETVRCDTLKIVTRIHTLISKGHYAALKEVSDSTIHNASIFQDMDSIGVAVITYSLSKILSKKHTNIKEIQTMLLSSFSTMKQALRNKDIHVFKRHMHLLFTLISDIDDSLRLYIDEVIRYAEIKKASKIYAHGVSMAQTAQLLGISEWELAQYVGQTYQKEPTTLHPRHRLLELRSIFGIHAP